MRIAIPSTQRASPAPCDTPVDAVQISVIGTFILLLVVLIAGAIWGPLAALATAVALFLACGGALVLLALRGFPPEDLEG